MMAQNVSFIEQLKNSLSQSYVWSKQHPADHLSSYSLIDIKIGDEIVIQVLSLQVQYNYGYTIHSYINPNHPVWMTKIGMMFGQGYSFNDNGEQQLVCPADPDYAASIIEKILLEVYGSLDKASVTCELP